MRTRLVLARTSLVASAALAVLAATGFALPKPPPGLCSWSQQQQRCVLVGHCYPANYVCGKDNPEAACGCRPPNAPPGGGG